MYHVRSGHLNLISRTHVRYSIRGGAGLVFVFLSLLCGLLIANVVISPVEGIQKIQEKSGQSTDTREILDEVVDKVGYPAVTRFAGASDEQADYLLKEKPALISAFIIVLIFFLPFLISLGAFNQTSGDIANRGLRYQLLRTERPNIFLGRFIGTFLFSLIVLAILVGVVMAYLVFKARFYDSGSVVLWLAQGYLAMAIYSLPWVALCAWVSTGIDSPFGALVIDQLLIGFWPILVYMAKGALPAAGNLGYLMPWGWKWWLVHPSPLHWLVGTVVMLAFTALFLWLGLRHFQKRDL